MPQGGTDTQPLVRWLATSWSMHPFELTSAYAWPIIKLFEYHLPIGTKGNINWKIPNSINEREGVRLCKDLAKSGDNTEKVSPRGISPKVGM